MMCARSHEIVYGILSIQLQKNPLWIYLKELLRWEKWLYAVFLCGFICVSENKWKISSDKEMAK